ncbi:MAG: phage protein Gp36 family protein [Petrimonas sp.]|nr:phage protein Gp36 family protein [Petrimonas sp.]
MSEFLQKTDYNASIHAEILDSLIRSDESLIEICEDRAILEMTSELSGRYDCDQLFSARNDDRNQLVMMMAMDIAIYHMFSIHNPQKRSAIRVERYKRATEWLKAVRAGKTGIPGAPVTDDPETVRGNYFMKSNPKRNNHR